MPFHKSQEITMGGGAAQAYNSPKRCFFHYPNVNRSALPTSRCTVCRLSFALLSLDYESLACLLFHYKTIMSAQQEKNLLDPSVIIHATSQNIAALASPYDAIAAACHSIMLSVGFRFAGLGDDARQGIDTHTHGQRTTNTHILYRRRRHHKKAAGRLEPARTTLLQLSIQPSAVEPDFCDQNC